MAVTLTAPTRSLPLEDGGTPPFEPPTLPPEPSGRPDRPDPDHCPACNERKEGVCRCGYAWAPDWEWIDGSRRPAKPRHPHTCQRDRFAVLRAATRKCERLGQMKPYGRIFPPDEAAS